MLTEVSVCLFPTDDRIQHFVGLEVLDEVGACWVLSWVFSAHFSHLRAVGGGELVRVCTVLLEADIVVAIQGLPSMAERTRSSCSLPYSQACGLKV